MGTLVFLDPDNGFETRTQRGPKWVRHAEVEWLLERLPESSAVAPVTHASTEVVGVSRWLRRALVVLQATAGLVDKAAN